MSCYSNIHLNIKTIDLNQEDKENILKHIEGNCGFGKELEINKNNVILNVQFNRGLNKIVDLIKLLEKFMVDYKEIEDVGSFNTEECFGLSDCSVYVCDKNIFIVKSEVEYGFVSLLKICINNLRDKIYHNSCILNDCNGEAQDAINEFIVDFIKENNLN